MGDLPLQRVELHESLPAAKEEAARLSLDYPYFIEVVPMEFRGGFFSLPEDAPREKPILFYLKNQVGGEEWR